MGRFGAEWSLSGGSCSERDVILVYEQSDEYDISPGFRSGAVCLKSDVEVQDGLDKKSHYDTIHLRYC